MRKLFSGSGLKSPKGGGEGKGSKGSGSGPSIGSKFFHRNASSSSTAISQPASPSLSPGVATGSPKSSHSNNSNDARRVYFSSPVSPHHAVQESSKLSSEMVPIVTLLSAQAHRKYHSGVILLLHDLKNDGTPADRQWREFFAILIGTQLALWLAKDIATASTTMATNNNNSNRNLSVSSLGLKEAASKPIYINFADATFRPLDGSIESSQTVPSATSTENILVVSTTLKNRLFLQFSDVNSFNEWSAAIRLSLFEFTLLQRAYTASLLSGKGKMIGDIQTILENTKFRYKDWVSVRFGAGMPWKRCYIVVSPMGHKRKKKRKFLVDNENEAFGMIELFEDETAVKKEKPMVTVVKVTAAYAVYPSSPKMIDSSTIVKLDASLIFENEDSNTVRDTTVFIMPEKHHGVPGYDTLIRFLVPVLNAYMLYGRPKGLIADRTDPDSLLFGLPTLPHVHCLRVQEIMDVLVNSGGNSNSSDAVAATWGEQEWTRKLTDLLHSKMANGYTGCDSEVKITGIGSASSLSAADLFEGSYSATSSSFFTNPSTASVPAGNAAATATAPAVFRTTPFRDWSGSSRVQTAATTPNPHSLRNVSMSSNLMAGTRGDLSATELIDEAFDRSASKIGDDSLDIVANIRDSSYQDDYNTTVNTSPFKSSTQQINNRSSPPITGQTLEVNNGSIQAYDNLQASPNEKYPNTTSQTRQFETSHIRVSSGSTGSQKSFGLQSSPVGRINNRQQFDFNQNRYSATEEYRDIADKINAIEISHSSPEATPTRNSLFSSPLKNANTYGGGKLLSNIDNLPDGVTGSPNIRGRNEGISYDSNRAEETGVFPYNGKIQRTIPMTNINAALPPSDSVHNPFRQPSSPSSLNTSGSFYEASSRPYSPVARPRNIHSPHSYRSSSNGTPLHTPPMQNRPTFSPQLDSIEISPDRPQRRL